MSYIIYALFVYRANIILSAVKRVEQFVFNN